MGNGKKQEKKGNNFQGGCRYGDAQQVPCTEDRYWLRTTLQVHHYCPRVCPVHCTLLWSCCQSRRNGEWCMHPTVPQSRKRPVDKSMTGQVHDRKE